MLSLCFEEATDEQAVAGSLDSAGRCARRELNGQGRVDLVQEVRFCGLIS